jgi:hypothetical protein
MASSWKRECNGLERQVNWATHDLPWKDPHRDEREVCFPLGHPVMELRIGYSQACFTTTSSETCLSSYPSTSMDG